MCLIRLVQQLLVMSISLGMSASVWAQGEASEAESPSGAEGEEGLTQAFQAFETGKQLFKERKFTEAALKFRQANALKPSWKLWFNIGQSEAAAKRNGLALEAFERYVSLGGDEIPAQRREMVMAEIARLQPVVGYIDLVAPEGSRVRIDGVERGTLPLAGPLVTTAAVAHVVLVENGSEIILNREVMVGGGRTVNVVVDGSSESGETDDLDAPDEPVASDEPKAPVSIPSRSTLATAGWAVFGVGLATLAAGGGTGITALMVSNDLKSRCPDGVCSNSADLGLEDKVGRLAVATDVLLAAGGTIAVTGLVLALVGRKRYSSEQDVVLNINPYVGPSQGGFFVEGSF